MINRIEIEKYLA